MKIINWFKRIIKSFRKVNMLNDPSIEFAEGCSGLSCYKLEIMNNEIDKLNIYEMFEVSKNQNIFSNDKVAKILELLNCTDEKVLNNINYEELDINNFRKNLKSLTNFPVSKLEIAILISYNPNIMYIENSIVENAISVLKKWINDELIVKNIIFNNPLVIDRNIEVKIKKIFEVFEELDFSTDLIKYILDENPNIVTMDEKRLENSLNCIKKIFNSKQEFEDEIVGNSNIIGIIDVRVLKNFVRRN